MSFSLVKTADLTFSRRVDIKIPTESGTVRTESFTAIFRLASSDESDDLAKLNEKDFCKSVMIGWKDVIDPVTKEQIPYSEDARDLLLAFPAAMAASPIAKAYVEGIQGKKYVSGN